MSALTFLEPDLPAVEEPLRPLLLIDVDGVLNAFRRPGPEWVKTKGIAGGRTFNLLLNPFHGPRLLDIAKETGCELVWATTWEHDANTQIGPQIGLPELPVIEVDRDNQLLHMGGRLMFKTPHVADWVRGRPFVWLDDDLTAADEKFLFQHPNVSDCLIIHVNGETGLTDDDFAEARSWLLTHGGGA
ncbi:HAD domain-containing protein [Streptosporangium sp. NPDC001559]|uniref:HAD domain-containing protein n=1 Tax=Streptosporangium sp. NPDC001559 TaxID=3366187 RepID=UPI0036EEDAF7